MPPLALFRYGRFCSPFRDADGCFGSLGPFSCYFPAAGSFLALLPPLPTVASGAVRHMNRLLAQADAKGAPLCFVAAIVRDPAGWQAASFTADDGSDSDENEKEEHEAGAAEGGKEDGATRAQRSRRGGKVGDGDNDPGGLLAGSRFLARAMTVPRQVASLVLWTTASAGPKRLHPVGGDLTVRTSCALVLCFERALPACRPHYQWQKDVRLSLPPMMHHNFAAHGTTKSRVRCAVPSSSCCRPRPGRSAGRATTPRRPTLRAPSTQATRAHPQRPRTRRQQPPQRRRRRRRQRWGRRRRRCRPRRRRRRKSGSGTPELPKPVR